jgi:hypothetical protein
MIEVKIICMGLAAVALISFAFWIPTRIRYRIGKNSLQILLFGLPVRWISLNNIEEVSKKHTPWAEQWWNTWKPHRRRLLIHRRKGVLKNVVITPKYRYQFKAELERAMAQHLKEN